MEDVRQIKVRVSTCRCTNCGTQRESYYLSDFSYGERLMLTSGGEYYAYINMNGDSQYDEVSLIVEELAEFHNIKLTPKEVSYNINKCFGIACDYINDLCIDASITKIGCLECGLNKFIYSEASGEYFKEIIFPIITHHKWEKLSDEIKRNLIDEDLYH